MFETEVSATTVAGWTAALAAASLDVDDRQRIDLIRALEELKCAAEGAQAELAADFDASQRRIAAEHGVPAERRGRGIAEQVALARRESPARGRQHLALAKALSTDMPCTGRALREGRITEFRATLLARATDVLSAPDRRVVDYRLAGDASKLEAMGDRQAAGEAAKLAAELDAASVCARRRKAESERCVSIRPAPDLMVYVTALLPVKTGVALYAALRAAAEAARASGDPRSRGQVMADTLCARVAAGSGPAEAPTSPVELNLVMTDRAVLLGANESAHLDGYGPIPADLARDLLTQSLDQGHRLWLRRLYTSPTTGQLVAMDSRRRLFPKGLRRLIRLRDRTCRSPYCDATIRHIDHSTDHQASGATSDHNGQGLCEACNFAKQGVGWRAGPVSGDGHEIETITPTGHRYRSRAPALTRPVAVEVRPGVWALTG